MRFACPEESDLLVTEGDRGWDGCEIADPVPMTWVQKKTTQSRFSLGRFPRT
jgi:hypothetical protein